MIKKSDIAAVCVAYNPVIPELRSNIDVHLMQVDKLYVIDNSDSAEKQQQVKSLCKSYTRCQVETVGENKGIAYALNLGCAKAIEDSFKWIITLDQDSTLPDNFVSTYLQYLNSLSEPESQRIAMLTCNMSTWKKEFKRSVDKVTLCWTSGALMRLDAYQETEGFDNELFIDCVDYDMCVKLILRGYGIMRINSLCLNHHLGNTKRYSLFGHNLFFITNYNPVRRYYMVRNGMYLSKKYSSQTSILKMNRFSMIKIRLKIILLEKDKIRKLHAIKAAINDFKITKLGKCEHTF